MVQLAAHAESSTLYGRSYGRTVERSHIQIFFGSMGYYNFVYLWGYALRAPLLMFRFGMADSPSCAFCQTEVESVEHLLFSCRVSSSFWKHVLSWLRDYNISIDNLKEEDVIFGKFDIAEDFLLFNHILLLGKFYIYSRKCQNGILSLQGFIARTRRIYNIELHIARKRDKLNNHFRKWEK